MVHAMGMHCLSYLSQVLLGVDGAMHVLPVVCDADLLRAPCPAQLRLLERRETLVSQC